MCFVTHGIVINLRFLNHIVTGSFYKCPGNGDPDEVHRYLLIHYHYSGDRYGGPGSLH